MSRLAHGWVVVVGEGEKQFAMLGSAALDGLPKHATNGSLYVNPEDAKQAKDWLGDFFPNIPTRIAYAEIRELPESRWPKAGGGA